MSVRTGGICSIEDCSKPMFGRTWCGMHYAIWRKYGDPLYPVQRRVRQGPTCSVEGCDRKPKSHGMCGMCLRRFQKYGETTDPRERLFWTKVDKNGPVPDHRPELGPCWIWSGYVHPITGYGQYGVRKGTRLAHRIGYEYAVGPIPEGLHLDHLCRVRRCLRWDHLQPVTPRENIARGLGGDSWGYTPDPLPPKPEKKPRPTTCTECDSGRPVYKRTLCRPCYRKWLKDPDVVRPLSLTPEQRFWAKVDKNGPIPEHRPELGPCWVWTATISRTTGYGRFGVRHGEMTGAHQYSYLLAHGSIPEKHDVHHACHLRRCVRPDHLVATTRSQNLAMRKSRR